LTEDQMAAFARWTNLSETTFLLPPTDPAADYRLRIWTPGGELPFAGHPTLGSAHAWLEAGGLPSDPDEIVQECGAGLVKVRRGQRLSFRAPPLTRTGPVDPVDLAAARRALRIAEDDVVASQWIDNGPGWMGVLLADAAAVLAIDPDWAAFGDLKIGVVGPYAEGPWAVELRAFCPGFGMPEDPVTGSLNAGVGQWLAGDRLPTSYVASQGTVLGRAGRAHVETSTSPSTGDREIWVGGDTATTIVGTVSI
ncbi:MAG: PhzF family phenazine biosynthesis protein, partial [Nocardioides sp.]